MITNDQTTTLSAHAGHRTSNEDKDIANVKKYIKSYKRNIILKNKLSNLIEFFSLCKRERVIPKGFQIKFWLASEVNNHFFVSKIQKECDLFASKLLDINLEQKKQKFREVEAFLKVNTHDLYERAKAGDIESIHTVAHKLARVHEDNLRKKHKSIVNYVELYKKSSMVMSKGSRKMIGINYVQESESNKHSKVKFFKCEHCDFSSCEGTGLNEHIKTVHEKEKDFKCEDCPFIAGQELQLKVHMESVHKTKKHLQCKQCDYSECLGFEPNMHIDVVHKNSQPNEGLDGQTTSVQEKRKDFECHDVHKIEHVRALHRKRKLQQSVYTTQDIFNRNPVCLDERAKEFLTEDHKSLLRKGGKFCPTPRVPINMFEKVKDFNRFRESLRWTYFHAKKNGFKPQENNFNAEVWYQRTKAKAPLASAPVEAFLEACMNDLTNPSLRRRITDNLTVKERIAMKDIQHNFGKHDLRVRMEDKGSRFVIVNSQVEKEQILKDLCNQIHYEKVEKDPSVKFTDVVRKWADRNLDKGDLTQDMHKFVTNSENLHTARPKPLFKTHKRNSNGDIVKPCPIRNVITACGTPVYNLAKFVQTTISHLVCKKNLPLRTGSTSDVLRRIFKFNKNREINLNENSVFIFPDIVSMYPSVDVSEAIDNICDLYEKNQGAIKLPTEELRQALSICQCCNAVGYNEQFFLPRLGIAMGPSHACDLTDIWINNILRDANTDIKVPHMGFTIYRDDGYDILINGYQDLEEYKSYLENVHRNIKWDIRTGKEAEYLDMFLYMENGRIESRVFKKSDPIYLSPKSCHDPSVFKGIFKSTGHRLRLICSKDHEFQNTALEYAKHLAISGYNYNNAKRELLSYLTVNRKKLLFGGGSRRRVIRGKDSKKEENTKKVFWISQYDPRMPHQRQIISRNYQILETDKKFAAFLPRRNIVSGSRRLKNLSEILSPTTPRASIGTDHEDVFKCPQCEFSGTQKVILDEHIKSAHSKVKYLKCEQCNFSSCGETELKEHIKIVHEKEKDFKCEEYSTGDRVLGTLSTEDLESLAPGGWLTDNILDLFSRLTMKNMRLPMDMEKKLLVVPPSVTLTLKLQEYETGLVKTLSDMGVTDKELVIFFVNDGSIRSEGSHWSVLIFQTEKSVFHHIDTLHNANKSHAKVLVKKIRKGLSITESQSIFCQEKLQDNLYDCGLYALKHAFMAIKHFLASKNISESAFCAVHNSSNVVNMVKDTFFCLKN